MTFWRTVTDALGLTRDDDGAAAGIVPPARAGAGWVTEDQALSLGTVFRAAQVLATSSMQLSIGVWRHDAELTPADVPGFIKTPALDMHRSAFIEETVTGLALTGNAYWFITRDGAGQPINAEPLPPHEVEPRLDSALRRVTGYTWRGKTYATHEIKHLQLLRRTGRHKGLGPIQAAQTELAGALDLRDYAGNWFQDSAVPSGVLTTDQQLTAELAAGYKKAWYGIDAAGNKADDLAGVKVLGNGLKYDPIMLKPADAQFLESRQYSTTEIARMFGIPASLMLSAVDGGSQTYSNVEQDWIGYTRFTLVNYLREIEEALTDLLPRGQTARFKIDALLRSDTKTRYESYALGVTAGWLHPDDVRRIEGMAPLTAAQRATLPANQTNGSEITQ